MLMLSGGDIALSRNTYGSPRSRAKICRISSSRLRRSISGTVCAASCGVWRGRAGSGWYGMRMGEGKLRGSEVEEKISDELVVTQK
jgi:hypothetical protein